jgi:PleD family two-component response regulator
LSAPSKDESLERHLSGIAAETADLARDLARQANTYKDLAYTDTLSGLPNRRAFEDRAARLRDFSDSKPLAVLMMDLDGFKPVNDSEGHEAGDRILALMARAIAGAFARATSSPASAATSLPPCCLAPIWARRRRWQSGCG